MRLGGGAQSGEAPGTPPGQISVREADAPLSPSKVSPADFEVLKVVGQGAFGKVCAAEAAALLRRSICVPLARSVRLRLAERRRCRHLLGGKAAV